MTFTYASSGLSSSSLFQVRLLIGDTSSSDPLLEDEEISYFVSAEGSVAGAAIAACDAIVAEFSRATDKTVGPFSESLSQRVDQYRKLAEKLRRDQTTSAGMYAGGISIAAKTDRESDSDRVVPAFDVAMLDNPYIGGTSS